VNLYELLQTVAVMCHLGMGINRDAARNEQKDCQKRVAICLIKAESKATLENPYAALKCIDEE